MKNSNNTIGNRTRDLPACSAVPQPTALPRVPIGHRTYRLVSAVSARLSRKLELLDNYSESLPCPVSKILVQRFSH